ncbi:MAG: hypothetical protein WCX82_03540 [archaeon]|jgi:hypothetical protein
MNITEEINYYIDIFLDNFQMMCSKEHADELITAHIENLLTENYEKKISKKETYAELRKSILVIKVINKITTYLIIRFNRNKDKQLLNFEYLRIFFISDKDGEGNTTNKGTFFVKFPDLFTTKVFIILSHVLDRINLRLDEKKTKTIRYAGEKFPDRIDALAELLESCNFLIDVYHSTEQNDSISSIEYGSFLGHITTTFIKKYNRPFIFVFWKTFIDNKLLRDDQLERISKSQKLEELERSFLKDIVSIISTEDIKSVNKDQNLTQIFTKSLIKSSKAKVSFGMNNDAKITDCIQKMRVCFIEKEFDLFYHGKKYYLMLIYSFLINNGKIEKNEHQCIESIRKIEPPWPKGTPYWLGIFPELDSENTEFRKAFNDACNECKKILNEEGIYE